MECWHKQQQQQVAVTLRPTPARTRATTLLMAQLPCQRRLVIHVCYVCHKPIVSTARGESDSSRGSDHRD
eukprot:COSAG01_NODE_3968_length_5483_cov_4.305906_12_plen_70_part_00